MHAVAICLATYKIIPLIQVLLFYAEPVNFQLVNELVGVISMFILDYDIVSRARGHFSAQGVVGYKRHNIGCVYNAMDIEATYPRLHSYLYEQIAS